MDITGLRLRCELAHAHVVDHALAQRTDTRAGVSHGSAPVEERGGLPRTQHGNRVGFLSPATRAQPEPHYRASGFVPSAISDLRGTIIPHGRERPLPRNSNASTRFSALHGDAGSP